MPLPDHGSLALENRKTAPSGNQTEPFASVTRRAVRPAQRFIADGAGAADFMLGRTRGRCCALAALKMQDADRERGTRGRFFRLHQTASHVSSRNASQSYSCLRSPRRGGELAAEVLIDCSGVKLLIDKRAREKFNSDAGKFKLLFY